MLRIVSRTCPLRSAGQGRRSLVSTVLLNRNWEHELVADLKQEARKRGLSQKGNKATLITRLHEYEKQRSIESVSPPNDLPALGQIRSVATSTTDVPGIPQSAAPPPPPLPQDFIAITLPDLSGPDTYPPVQIPYTPDFWDSSLESTPHAAIAELIEPLTPKLHVVAGFATHIGGGPSHQIHDVHEPLVPDLQSSSSSSTLLGSLWKDVSEDLGLPSKDSLKIVESNKEHKAFLGELGIPEETTTSGAEKNHERQLDEDEKKGLMILGGILIGGWLAGSIFSL